MPPDLQKLCALTVRHEPKLCFSVSYRDREINDIIQLVETLREHAAC